MVFYMPAKPYSMASNVRQSEQCNEYLVLCLPAESESSRLERFIQEEYAKRGIQLESISVAVQEYYTWCIKNGREP